MNNNKGKIIFHNEYGPFSFPHRNFTKDYILKLFKKEGRRVEAVNYIFCSDEYLININQEYLNHDTFTDIITFELSSADEPVISDIYLSIDRIKENAQQFNTSFKKELLRVLFHGALHLCGYKDKNKAQQEVMKSKEEFYLNHYIVPRGTM